MTARQEVDGADLRVPAAVLHLSSVDEALALVERFSGADRLTANTQPIVEDVLAHLGRSSDG